MCSFVHAWCAVGGHIKNVTDEANLPFRISVSTCLDVEIQGFFRRFRGETALWGGQF
jgi:hypothetical protein